MRLHPCQLYNRLRAAWVVERVGEVLVFTHNKIKNSKVALVLRLLIVAGDIFDFCQRALTKTLSAPADLACGEFSNPLRLWNLAC